MRCGLHIVALLATACTGTRFQSSELYLDSNRAAQAFRGDLVPVAEAYAELVRDDAFAAHGHAAVRWLREKPDELVDPTAADAYHAMGEELSYLPLGMLPDAELLPQALRATFPRSNLQSILLQIICAIISLRLDAFRESSGTLEERLWKRYIWQFPPADETQSCWCFASWTDRSLHHISI